VFDEALALLFFLPLLDVLEVTIASAPGIPLGKAVPLAAFFTGSCAQVIQHVAQLRSQELHTDSSIALSQASAQIFAQAIQRTGKALLVCVHGEVAEGRSKKGSREGSRKNSTAWRHAHAGNQPFHS